jgi:uncharacterized protein YerC
MKHCSICCHPQRASIENALLEGKSCNKIATATGASWSAIYRHSQHLERANLHVLTEAVTNVPILDESNVWSRGLNLLPPPQPK